MEFQFDAMVLATGCKEDAKPIYRGDNKKNAFYYNSPYAHKRLKKILNRDESKKVILLGVNLEA